MHKKEEEEYRRGGVGCREKTQDEKFAAQKLGIA